MKLAKGVNVIEFYEIKKKKDHDHVRVFFDKFPNTLKKFIQSGKENLLSKGWRDTFIITSYPDKISPREGKCRIYRNIGQGNDVYGSIRPAALNKEVCKYNRLGKL